MLTMCWSSLQLIDKFSRYMYKHMQDIAEVRTNQRIELYR
jgi:hypothetical protein